MNMSHVSDPEVRKLRDGLLKAIKEYDEKTPLERYIDYLKYKKKFRDRLFKKDKKGNFNEKK